MASKVRIREAQPKVTEQDLLQGFKQFVRMLDISFQPEDKASVTTADKLVAEYFLFFKNAACTLSSQRRLGSLGQVAALSWDAIIAATKDSIFFEANPRFFENHTPDLKYKPSVEHKGLHQCAHSSNQLTREVAQKLATELVELSIFNKNISVPRLRRLKKGLLNRHILIDGFRHPYQVLIPFLTLGCLRLERYEHNQPPVNALDGEDYQGACVALDVLADAANVLSAMSSMPRPATGN